MLEENTIMQQVVNSAAKSMKSHKKDQIFSALKEFIVMLEDENTHLHHADIERLAAMYSYFLPTITKPKTPFSWVAKAAAGKKDPRDSLHHVYVDEDHIVATDGRRLHLIPKEEGVAAGFYNTVGDSIDVHCQFPRYQGILPDKAKCQHQKISVKELTSGEVVAVGKIHKINVIADVWVRLPCLKEAVSYNKPADMIEVYYSDGNSAVTVAFEDGREAIITPSRK